MAKAGKTRHALSIEQLNAVDLLVTGKSDREVAEAVGVSRQTVCGWRLYDPYFQAELNKRRKEVWGASLDKLRSLLPKALEVVERELEGGNNSLSAALKVLQMVNIAGLTRDVGSADPEEIIDDGARRRLDPLKKIVSPPVSDEERRQVLADLRAKQAQARDLAMPRERSADGLHREQGH
jgi:hypothetical protein